MYIKHFIDVLNANLRKRVSVNIVVNVEIEFTYF